jgi:hypothetical protein
VHSRRASDKRRWINAEIPLTFTAYLSAEEINEANSNQCSFQKVFYALSIIHEKPNSKTAHIL